MWYRIRESLNFDSQIILNRPVVQTIYFDGTVSYKDVDGGLGHDCDYKGNRLFIPILTNEDKGGHFCATTASNVNSINRKFKDLNPNIITMATTDNNVTIAKDKDHNFLEHTNIVFSIRGVNGVNTRGYSPLIPSRFDVIEESLISELNKRSLSDFDCDKIKIQLKENKTIRENIDDNGFLIKY